MRIIAGIHKNRRLFVPENDAIRPTSSRTRESLFNVLMHGSFGGDCVIGARVADICCGTGALGFEALSRGAEHCSFVDSSRAALQLAEKNAKHLGVTNQCNFLHHDARKLPRIATPYDLIMTDPPYDDHGMITALYSQLQLQGWLKEGTVLATEVPSYTKEIALEGAEIAVERRYGKAALCIWRVHTIIAKAS